MNGTRQQPSHANGAARFTPLRILIVEDEMMPALLLEEAVILAGHQARKAARLSKAIELCDSESFDAAVLDVNVNGQQVFPLATKLRASGVPMLFATGYGEDTMPAEFRGYPVLQKPYGLDTFNRALGGLLQGLEHKSAAP